MDLKEFKQIKLRGGDSMKTKIKQERGITLIALVITIVVLLILAGVSVNAIFSDNGIIKRAQEAQSKMDEAQQNDLTAINNLNNWIDNVTGETSGTGDDSQTSETWVLNETLNLGTTAWSYNIEFSSNGKQCNEITHYYTEDQGIVMTNNLRYNLEYGDSSPENITYIDGDWIDEAYRTVTFSVPPTGALLTWLQQNGTKQ